jgi:hypothetical protein
LGTEFDKWVVEFVKGIVEFDKCLNAVAKRMASPGNLIEQSKKPDCQYGQPDS